MANGRGARQDETGHRLLAARDRDLPRVVVTIRLGGGMDAAALCEH